MSSSHSPVEQCIDGADADSDKNGSVHQPRTTARLATERAYRAATRSSVATPEGNEAPPNAVKGMRSPPPPDALMGSRHADVPRSANATATPTATSAAAAATAAPATNVTPTSVRGRSGSTTQYRVYQPSSLFGTNAPAPCSRSSSLLATDTATQRRLTATTMSDAEESLEKTASTLPRRSMDDPATPAESPSTVKGEGAGLSSPWGTATSTTPYPSMDRRSGGAGAASSTNNTPSEKNNAGVVPRRGSVHSVSAARTTSTADTLKSTTAAAAGPSTTAAQRKKMEPRTRSSSEDSGLLSHDGSEREGDAACLPPAATAAAATVRRSTMRLAEYAAERTADTHAGLPSSEGTRAALTEMRSTSPLAVTTAQKVTPTTAEEAENDSLKSPFTMSSLVAHVAVPASVQDVLKNPSATKTELWTALRTACQQCVLLHRRLAKMSGQLTAEDEAEELSGIVACALKGETANAQQGGLQGGERDEDKRAGASSALSQTRRCSVSALPHAAPHSANSTKAEEDALEALPVRMSKPAAAPPAAQANDAYRRSRERAASIASPVTNVTTNTNPAAAFTAAAAAAARGRPASPLSTSSLQRSNNTRLGSVAQHTTTSLSSASGADVSSVLRSRFADEIRRVEATRKGLSAAPSAATTPSAETTQRKALNGVKKKQSSGAQASDGEGDGSRTTAPPVNGVRSSSGDGSSSHAHAKDVGTTNITVKVPQEIVLGRRIVRDAVVKSREVEPRPSLGSPPPPSRDAQMPRRRHTNDGEEEGSDGDPLEDAPRGQRSGSVASTGDRGGLRRHASDASEAASVRSGNTFALPSIPSASMENTRKSSFMSRSHNSGRVAPPRPPSASTSESVAASGYTATPTAAPQQHHGHRRVRGASFASVESASAGREGSVGSSGALAGPTAVVPPISMRALTSSITLPSLRREEMLNGPLSARPARPCVEAEDDGRAAPAAARVGGVQQSNWLGRSGSLASPLNAALPSIPSASSSMRSPGADGITPPLEATRPHSIVQHSPRKLEARTRQHSANRRGEGRALSPLAQHAQEEPRVGANAAPLTCTTAHVSCGMPAAPPSLLEMVRQVAAEDAPVSPVVDDKKAELREWRRQAAKAGGMRGAPSTF